jgi:virginiamycin B lyase
VNKIGHITVDGTCYDELNVTPPNSRPTAITAGSNGALYFIEANANQIGRITFEHPKSA